MLKLDHFALSCSNLGDGQALVEEVLGVKLHPGGQHSHFGTHNLLLGLGPDLYFEVIAKNPDAAPTGRATWFGLDTFDGAPRLGNWICSVTEYADVLETAPSAVGQPVSLRRDDITWQLTVPEDGTLPYDGAYPSLIKWGAGVVPPPAKLPDVGIRLRRWEVHHPNATEISKMVPLSDDRVSWVVGPQGFRAEFETPNGIKVLT